MPFPSRAKISLVQTTGSEVDLKGPAGLLTSMAGEQASAAMAALLVRLYTTQVKKGNLAGNVSFKKWLKPIINTAIISQKQGTGVNGMVFEK